MKKISGLLELVEIQSTPASIFPVLMGLLLWHKYIKGNTKLVND